MAGVPVLAQGINFFISAAGYATYDDEDDFDMKAKFGFEFEYGSSIYPELSKANRNAFTINGKIYKLKTMDTDKKQFDPKYVDIPNHSFRISPRFEKENYNSEDPYCDLMFLQNFNFLNIFDYKVINIFDWVNRGHISGYCETRGKNN